MGAGYDIDLLLRVGTVFCVHSEHFDAANVYEFRLRAAGGGDLDCVYPALPEEGFRAVFTKAALSKGDALLAVTQMNPCARTIAARGTRARRGARRAGGRGPTEDGKRHGKNRPRRFTFRCTTPPFLLSEKLGKLVRERKPVPLHFYDFLDEGKATELVFVAERPGTIKVNKKPRKVRIVRYEKDDFALEVLSGTRVVRLISRTDGEFRMELVEVRVPRVGRN